MTNWTKDKKHKQMTTRRTPGPKRRTNRTKEGQIEQKKDKQNKKKDKQNKKKMDKQAKIRIKNPRWRTKLKTGMDSAELSFVDFQLDHYYSGWVGCRGYVLGRFLVDVCKRSWPLLSQTFTPPSP